MINCINTCAGDSFRYESKGHTHKDCDLADDISARALVIHQIVMRLSRWRCHLQYGSGDCMSMSSVWVDCRNISAISCPHLEHKVELHAQYLWYEHLHYWGFRHKSRCEWAWGDSDLHHIYIIRSLGWCYSYLSTCCWLQSHSLLL